MSVTMHIHHPSHNNHKCMRFTDKTNRILWGEKTLGLFKTTTAISIIYKILVCDAIGFRGL